MGFKTFVRRFFKKADDVVTVTTAEAEYIEDEIDSEPAKVDDISTLCSACFYNKTEWFNQIIAELSTNHIDINGSICHEISPIVYASYYGNLDIARTLLEQGAEVNVQDTFHESKRTPLIFAAQKGYAELVALLIENGARLDDTEFRNYSALMVATEGGHVEIAQTLVAHGAKLDVKSSAGLTALMIAAKNNQPEIAQSLIDNNVALNEKSIPENTYNLVPEHTALHFAAENNAFEVAEHLLKGGADFTIEDKYGRKPIALAISAGHPEVIQCLLRYGETLDLANPELISDAFRCENLGLAKLLMDQVTDINFMVPPISEFGATDRTPFTIAVTEHDKELIDLVLSKGVIFDRDNHSCDRMLYRAAARGFDGAIRVLVEAGMDIRADAKAFFAAITSGHEETVKLLIDLGSDIHAVGEFNKASTLIEAVARGNKAMAEILLQAGANVDYKTPYGETALVVAFGEGDKEMVKYLLDNHAHNDICESEDELFFLLAAKEGDLEALESLLRKGVAVDVSTRGDQTALTLAVHNDHVDCVKFLLDNGANPIPASGFLSETMKSHSLEISDLLVANGADKPEFDMHDGALLLNAIRNDCPHIAEYLILNDANLDGVTVEGNAQIGEDYERHWPIIVAAEKGHADVVALLIQKGADVNVSNHYGDTALKYAAQNGHVRAARVLLENGADANKGNYIRYIPMMDAVAEGHAEVVMLLIEYGADVDYENPNDSSGPMKIAYDREHSEIVDILMLAGASHTRRY
ncbi:MAG: ankyrin repeat domain-containing protein [Gammaproteobacteria bacterium]|nr:ankyrin repeat domain-containing protein [Gammaproteobacteria bacterium]